MVVLALLASAASASADTIVLKNGRRITAFNVVETAEKITYQTSAGELTLPKSIVDHIEKGGMVAMPGTPGADAASLVITPPTMAPVSGEAEIAQGAVHDGAVDRVYIAKLEGQARTGGSSSGNSRRRRPRTPPPCSS